MIDVARERPPTEKIKLAREPPSRDLGSKIPLHCLPRDSHSVVSLIGRTCVMSVAEHLRHDEPPLPGCDS